MAMPRVIFGAGNGVRTRDPQLGKLVLYQLSYARSSDVQSPQKPFSCQVVSCPYFKMGSQTPTTAAISNNADGLR